MLVGASRARSHNDPYMVLGGHGDAPLVVVCIWLQLPIVFGPGAGTHMRSGLELIQW